MVLAVDFSPGGAKDYSLGCKPQDNWLRKNNPEGVTHVEHKWCHSSGVNL